MRSDRRQVVDKRSFVCQALELLAREEHGDQMEKQFMKREEEKSLVSQAVTLT